jgi:hypothetical protein
MTGAIVATSLVLWPAAPFFLFMHGKDTTIPKGTEITAYVNGEVKLNLASHSTQPPAPPAVQIVTANPATQPATAPKGITVRFTSTPANAEVDVDGSYWGSTPSADLTRLPEGSHTVVVRKAGYQRWERKVDLAAGDNRTVNAELELDADKTKARISGL